MNSKILPALVLTALCIVVDDSAQAAGTESVELKVTGTISMGACLPVLDNGGLVDFGKISSNALNSAAANDLGVKSTLLTITCDSPSRVAFTVADNEASSAMTAGLGSIASGNVFGLGKTADSVNIGSYSITLASVTLDGTAGDILTSTDGTTWSAASSNGLVDNGGATQWSAGTAGANNDAAAATTFVYGVNVNAVLQDATILNIQNDTSLAGSATFTLVYL